jgi:hypothetical protein
MRYDEPPKRKRVYLSCTALVCVSAIAALCLPVPDVRVHLLVTTSTYTDGQFQTSHVPGPLPDFRVFVLSLAVALTGALTDVGCALQQGVASRIAEACVTALGAVAVYVTLGGTTLVAALLAAVLTFTSALSDGVYVLALSLVATLWDACFASGPGKSARTLLAVAYVGYSFAIEATRAKEYLNTVITAAWHVASLWLSYAVLISLKTAETSDTLYLAGALPLLGVLVFVALDSAKAEVPLVVEETYYKSKGQKRSKNSLRV